MKTMTPKKLMLAVLAVGVAAGLALGQSSGKSTARGDYRITLVSPIEGSTVPADQVRVVLTPNTTAMGDDKTQIDIFLDDQQKGVIKATETDFRVDGVKPGPHKLVLIARNPVTDQQFDRREISFIASGDGSTSGATVTGGTERSVGAHVPAAVNSTERQHSYTATDATQSAQSDMRVASSSTSDNSYSSSSTSTDSRSSSLDTNPPKSSSTSSYSSSTTTASDTVARNDERLPQTASSDALLAIAGAGLLVTGLALRRRS
jgi:LPXTG-motif cell wall-anchored protein